MTDGLYRDALAELCPHLRPILDAELASGNRVDYSEVAAGGRVLIRLNWQFEQPSLTAAAEPVRRRPPRPDKRARDYYCPEHRHTLTASPSTRAHRDPPWWTKALELEAQDRLEEAEETVREGMRPQGTPWPAQLAALYEHRMRRLAAAGAPASLIDEARHKAADWMDAYASCATSGGEGAALSLQAREYRKYLGLA